tara:strand:- start:3491 stop:4339 length:849 start_codon:yes stop_codon:yes gene_type:complete
VDGVRTRYVERGSGDPIVLLHGGNFGASSSADAIEDWGRSIDDLANWCHVFAIDKLGQGYTDNPKTDDHYTMQAVVDHAYKAIKTLGLEATHIMGHSRGGYVACRLTVDYPEISKSCIIVDSNTCAPGTSLNENVFADITQDPLSKSNQRLILERYSYNPSCVTKEWIDALVNIAKQKKYIESVKKMTDSGLLWTKFLPGLQTDKEDLFQSLKSDGIKRPVMQILGFNDPTVTRHMAFELYQILAQKQHRARWHILNEAGHFSFREQPDQFNNIVRSFVSEY